jgi:hypothetical protein
MAKNVVELREDLSKLFDEIKNETIEVNIAAEMNNTAGKIIGTLKSELEYAHARGIIPNIAYLEAENE